MNIAVTAPKRFAHQDLVCVDLALRWRDAAALTMTPEPTGGEDARVTWRSGSVTITLDVQIKDEVGDVDLERLVDILTHFPAKQAQHTLLERLVADPNSAALLVMSARCRDEVASLLAPSDWDGSFRTKPVASATLADDLLSAIAARAAGASRTDLEAARAAHLLKVAKSSAADVRAALDRVFIAERERPAEIVIRVQGTLRTGYRVPSDRLGDGCKRLAAIIDAAKGTDQDAVVALLAELAKLAPTSMLPSDYVERGTEGALATSLANKSVLLLSGAPRTGKTWTARAIAARLQEQGVAVRVGSGVDEAERYLRVPDGAERCFILEDPFGSQLASATAATDAGSLRRLVDVLTPDRRLVVSQRREPLLETMRQESVGACAINGVHWHDLGEIDVSVSIAIWRAASSNAGLERCLVEKVEDLIRGDELREPGALTFLAANARDLPADADTAQILTMARRDAAGIASEVVERIPGIAGMMVALAVSTAPTSSVADAELAFALRADGDRPTRSSRIGRTITMGASKRTPEPTPAYADAATLKSEDQALLEALIKRRLVVAESPSESNFTHAFYRAAGQILSLPETRRSDVPALGKLDAALFSLSPRTSRSAARNMSWLLAGLKERPEAVKALFELAADGLASLFPATRDLCFAFLIDNLDRIPKDFRVDLQSWVGRVIVNFQDVSERDGEAWLDDGDMDGSEMFRRQYERPAVDTVEPLLLAIERSAPLDLDFATARQMLRSLDRQPERLSEMVARRLLAFDEAMVRAEVARLWLSVPRDQDADLLSQFEKERHPTIAVSALQGAVQAWPDLEPDRRARLTNLIDGLAASPGSAIALFLELIVFDRVEHYGQAPPWSLFSRVIASALRQLPLRLVFNDGRLPNAITHAIKHVDAATIAPALTAWAARIVAQIAEHLLPSEFELALVPIMVRGTKAAPHCRAGLIHALLEVPSTAARILIVSDLVDCWADLQDDERADLIALLRRDASDQTWMQAAAITREIVPAPLQEVVLGAVDALSRTMSEVEASLSPELLAAGLRIHAGEPQPLWWIGTHHRRSQFWEAYVLDVARRPAHADFEIAFECSLLQPADEAALEAMIAQADDADLDTVFETMLAKIRGATAWNTSSWRSLLERGQRSQRLDRWLDRMSAAAPQILEGLSDIRAWLGEGPIATRFMSSFETDRTALAVARALRTMRDIEEELASQVGDNDDDGADDESAAELIEIDKEAVVRRLLDDRPPVFEDSLKALSDALIRTGSLDQDLLKRLEENRLSAIEARYRTAPGTVAELAGWIGPR